MQERMKMEAKLRAMGVEIEKLYFLKNTILQTKVQRMAKNMETNFAEEQQKELEGKLKELLRERDELLEALKQLQLNWIEEEWETCCLLG